MKNNALNLVAWILVVVGAINWGLFGLGQFLGGNWNVVYWIFSSWPAVEAIIYILVGIAGIFFLFGCRCRTCLPKGSNSGSSAPMA